MDRHSYTRLAWAGFVNNKPHVFEGVLQIYPIKKDAQTFYEDVRRVEIRELPKATGPTGKE